MNFKFALLVVAVSILAYLAWAQQKPIALKSDVGRFQIIAQPSTNDMFGDTYLLDSTTGRVWQKIHLQSANGDDNGLEGKPHVWVPMTRLDSARDLDEFSVRHPEKSGVK